MRPLILAATLSAVFAAAPAFAADPVEGDWITKGGLAKAHIGPCPGQPAKICGKLVSLKEPNDTATGKPKTDIHNPNAGLHSRPIAGLPFLTGFDPAGAGKWKGGKIYDPESGKTYDSKMEIGPNGTLKVAGCVSIICQTQIWTRP